MTKQKDRTGIAYHNWMYPEINITKISFSKNLKKKKTQKNPTSFCLIWSHIQINKIAGMHMGLTSLCLGSISYNIMFLGVDTV